MSQRLYPNQLPSHLNQQLAPCYLLFGDEPLQQLEAIQHIQQSAQQRGFSEVVRVSLDSGETAQLVDALQGMSLFSSQKIVLLDAANGKLDKSTTELLQHYAAMPSPDIVLVLYGHKLESAQKNRAWFKALLKLGIEITLTQPSGNQLYRWLNDRCRTLGIQLQPEASQLLVESHEGNLLALSQELDKLQLLYPQQKITAQQVHDVAVDQSRYSVFQLSDALLSGDMATALHMLEQLKQADMEPLVLLWAINRELATLHQLLQPEARNKEAQLFKSLRIWPSRQSLFKQAMHRLSLAQLAQCEQLLAEQERLLKGGASVSSSPWPMFSTIAMMLCGTPVDAAWLLPAQGDAQ